jgi:hydrogenase small subunit
MNAPETPKALDVVWLTAGLSCDGDSVAITAATQPSLEDLVLGALPGVPLLRLHHPVFAFETSDFLRAVSDADEGRLKPFVLVVEGSIPDENNKDEGYWAAFGGDHDRQPTTTCSWIDRLAPKALAVVAAGTCAAYGGVHALSGNVTGCGGLIDYLGHDWRTESGGPLICVPGCPVHPDNFMEVLLYLLSWYAGMVPPIKLDDQARPTWLFEQTVHQGCDRGGYYEQADFAREYGSRKCLVKLGCWGPVVQCNVGQRGWINGVGGCPNVGGVCIGCTMPGFPDKFMQAPGTEGGQWGSFLDEPPGARLSTEAILTYGRAIRKLRQYTQASMNTEPTGRLQRPGPGVRE